MHTNDEDLDAIIDAWTTAPLPRRKLAWWIVKHSAVIRSCPYRPKIALAAGALTALAVFFYMDVTIFTYFIALLSSVYVIEAGFLIRLPHFR